MKHWLSRIVYGALFALPMMFITYALAQASPQPQEGTIKQHSCPECHESFQTAWENGAHGRSTTDPAFRKEWDAQGQPKECLACHVTGYDPETNTWESDGITCTACHGPVTAGHPLSPMAINRAADTCANCHTEAYFEWQISAHRESGVECAACHDPHKTALKEDASQLCASCHPLRSENFAHSAHSQEGLTCADCHLSSTGMQPGQGASALDHSFFVSLQVCNQCHEYQMHDPVAVHEKTLTPPMVELTAAEDTVTAEPKPVGPFGFSTLAGLVGLAFGIVLAPWIERLYRHNRKN